MTNYGAQENGQKKEKEEERRAQSVDRCQGQKVGPDRRAIENHPGISGADESNDRLAAGREETSDKIDNQRVI